MMHSIAAFAVLSLVLTVTPGPDSLLVLRSSLRSGRRAGIRVAGGAAVGSLAWGVGSAAGVTAVLAASAQLYRAVQLAGAAYLMVLGIRSWRARSQHRPGPGRAPRRQRDGGFRTGLLSNLLNPKVGLFFLAIMPQLIPHHGDAAGYALAFAVTDMVIAGGWLAVVAWISDRAGALLRHPRAQAVLDRTAGTVLVALGLKVAAEQFT